MQMRKLTSLTLLLSFVLAGPCLAVTPWEAHNLSQSVAAGTWSQSETLFRDLLAKNTDPKDDLTLKYDLGLSLLHQKKHEEAQQLFETVVKDSDDVSLKAKASYNLGNTLFALYGNKTPRMQAMMIWCSKCCRNCEFKLCCVRCRLNQQTN